MISFAWRLARRETRAGLGRFAVFLASITLGVGALVAIHGFRGDVTRSIERQEQALLGADVEVVAERPLPEDVTAVVDSLRGRGHRVSSVTSLLSMGYAPRTEGARLLQVRSVEGGFPFYGEVRTDPAGRWGAHRQPGRVLVDRAGLLQLGAEPGDTLVLGAGRFEIAAAVEDLPSDIGFQTALGPRVFLSPADLEVAGLLTTGSLSKHTRYVEMPSRADRDALLERYGERFRVADVRVRTAAMQAQELTEAVDFLSRYLGLVGLAALLLGGIGVASAIHVYVRERLDGIAVLRCLGAGQWTVFRAYLLQAGALGLVGSAAGVGLGLLVQLLLPALLSGLLPVRLEAAPSGRVLAAGLGVGLWVSVLFALGPLLEVRDVPPLRALRRDYGEGGGEASSRRPALDPWRVGVWTLLALSLAGLAALEAPTPSEGLAFSAALGVVVGLLALAARGLIALVPRVVPSRAPYPLRQGFSNLFRPRNQTLVVTLSVGFGVFVIGTVGIVQASLSESLGVPGGEATPNLLLFDVLPDQLEGVEALLPSGARETVETTPIVSARIDTILPGAAEGGRPRPERWALEREYRHTYRAAPTEAEEVVEGRWWSGRAPEGETPEISVEVDVADDLGLALGDTVVWSVAGRPVPGVVTSLRRVDWNRFGTNFFVVFQPGALEAAPRTAVLLARVDDAERRAAFQRELTVRYPNVSALDLARVQETVAGILTQVRRTIDVLAGFSAAAGFLVLLGALANARGQRVREGALLRTLGARRGQVRAVLAAEYAALGGLAATTGLLLAGAAAGALVEGVFDVPLRWGAARLGLLWLLVCGVTVLIGLSASRGVLTRPPLPALREERG